MTDDDIIVILNGQQLSLAEVKKQFADLSFITKLGTKKIIEALFTTEAPLTIIQITQSTNLAKAYIVVLMKQLLEKDYVARFHLCKTRIFHYALTERGYNWKVNQNANTD